MNVLVIGAGQVGSALKSILQKTYEVYIRDVDEVEVPKIDVLHICYPDHEGFEEATKKYIAQYQPSLTIINSSVRVGTTRKCGSSVVYSPVRGRHPKLAEEIRSFNQFLGSIDVSASLKAQEYFEKAGFTTYLAGEPESLELLKVLSNVHMGWEIAWRQEVKRILNHFTIFPSVYRDWELTYRDGYLKTGDLDLIRSVMRPDPIGGHCVLQCTELLRSQIESKALDFIVESNERVKEENGAPV